MCNTFSLLLLITLFSLYFYYFCVVNSFVLILTLTRDCLGATTGGRATGIIAPATGNTQGNKNSRNIMHPAFQNAGKTAGLEIWRVEVNISFFFYIKAEHQN